MIFGGFFEMSFVEKQIEKLPDGGELEVVVYYRKLR